MTTQTGGLAAPSAIADPVTARLLQFLAERRRGDYRPDEDLFASGGISSLFALELVLFLEQAFGVMVTGPELKLANFRTVHAMTALVHRLTSEQGSA